MSRTLVIAVIVGLLGGALGGFVFWGLPARGLQEELRQAREQPAALERELEEARRFGNESELVAERRGDGVDALIERIERAARAYPYGGEYRLWPGPNLLHSVRCERCRASCGCKSRLGSCRWTPVATEAAGRVTDLLKLSGQRPTVGGSASRRAATRVKPEQASKVMS